MSTAIATKTTTYSIDKAHSEVTFQVRHLLTKVRGRFSDFEGAIEFDMLFGTERYKWLWARAERPLVQVQLFPPHIGGVLHRRAAEAERTMRTIARRLLTTAGARA